MWGCPNLIRICINLCSEDREGGKEEEGREGRRREGRKEGKKSQYF